MTRSVLLGTLLILGLALASLPVRAQDANAPGTAAPAASKEKMRRLSPEEAAAALKASNIPFDRAIPIWDGLPPDASPDASPSTEFLWPGPRIWHISIPTLIPYFPDHPNGTAIIFCAGGGFSYEQMASADLFARYFVSKNITVFALKYRLMGKLNAQGLSVEDGKKAVQLVRSRAAEWHLDPQRIGLAGESAGANVVLHVLSEFEAAPAGAMGSDAVSSRPDFAILLACWAFKDTASPYPLRKNSPPVFLCHADDDKTAPAALSESIAQTLTGYGVPVKLYQVPSGGHGAFGLGPASKARDWPDTFLPWLKTLGLVSAPQTVGP